MKFSYAVLAATAATAQYANWGASYPAYNNWGATTAAYATPAVNYGYAGATLPSNWAAATAPVARTAATTATANWAAAAAPVATANWATPYTAAPAYNLGSTYNFGSSTLGAYPYQVPRTSFLAPVRTVSCSDRAIASWLGNDPNDSAYDGRTLTFNIIPAKTIVNNLEELNATNTGFNTIANWESTPINVESTGNKVTFEVDWKGSKSNINGNVVPEGFSRTFHVFDCNKKDEQVYGDFGGMMQFMGVPAFNGPSQ